MIYCPKVNIYFRVSRQKELAGKGGCTQYENGACIKFGDNGPCVAHERNKEERNEV